MSLGLERSERMSPSERITSPRWVARRPKRVIVALMCVRPTSLISILVAVLSLSVIISHKS